MLGWPLLDAGTSQMAVASLCLFMAILLLDAFDISLPRGDSMGVSGALVGASVFVVGLLPASALALFALLVAGVVRGRHVSAVGHLVRVGVRAASLSVTAASLYALRGLDSDWMHYGVVAAGPAVYLLSELTATQTAVALETRRSLARLIRGNLGRLAPLIAAQVSTAVLTVIIFPAMDVWGLIPVVALLLIMRQSYAALLDIRETYRMTVEVLVQAAEGLDPILRGHGERTAGIARAIGMRVGLTPTEVERVNYAALLHDVDALSGSMEGDHGHSSEVFRDADYFSDVASILRICDGEADCRSFEDRDLLAAMIVALASDIDCAAQQLDRHAHSSTAISRVSSVIPGTLKAKAVAAALELGYRIPAVN